MKYTDVKFNISDPIWQKVYDAAEEKARLNVLSFCSRPVLIEGGGYNGIWLETQPMGGEMYAMRNMEAAMNNQLFFMGKHTRGRKNPLGHTLHRRRKKAA